MSAEQTTSRRSLPTGVLVAVCGVFGLFYAYAVWNALDFLIAQASGSLGLSAYGWFVLVLAVVFPLIAFGVAFAIGVRRAWWELVLVLLAGLGLVAVFWLNVVAYSAAYGASLLG